MSDQNIPQDLQAARQAQPQERAFQDSNVFSPNGVGFQGSPQFESYDVGNENNALDGIGQGQFNQGVSMGGLDAASLYPVANSFPDQHPTYDATGYDSMRGLNSGAIPISLSGDQMYVSPNGLESVGFHQYPGVNPEIAGETTPE